MRAELKDIKRIPYAPGMFDEFKAQKQIERWDSFPELMWSLGYEMDGGRSFERFRKYRKLKSDKGPRTSDERENTLFLLRHAKRQVVGNYLFSEWRYFTHQARGFDGYYDYEFLCRIIEILESIYG